MRWPINGRDVGQGTIQVMTSFATPSDFDVVQRVALSGRGPREGINELLNACAARFSHPVRQMLRTLDVETDTAMLRQWLAQLLQREPVPVQIKGLYFGLAEYADDDRDATGCRLHLVGSANFDPQDEECQWALQPTYMPDADVADSEVLTAIYRDVQAAGPDVVSLGEYVLGFGYASLVVRTVCHELRVSVLGEAAWRGVAVGFDCGDAIVLGRIESTGWRPTAE
jgi:hypothetical protein